MKDVISLKRRIGTEVSERTYYNLIGLFLSYGFIVNILMVAFLGDFARTMHIGAFLIFYFVSSIAGIVIMNKSKSTLTSFIGYNLLVTPIGLLLASALPNYKLSDIAFAFGTTLFVTMGMIIISNIKPKVFRNMGSGLLISLLLLIIVEIIMAILGVFTGWINFIACLIFSLYIGYDWVKAGDNYKSTTTAVLAAADLYLDIINLFIRILNIKDSD